MAPRIDQKTATRVGQRLGARAIVLVGLMGCGKSSVGRRLASTLGLTFFDADCEIEAAAGKTIPDIFADHGEAYFRNGERKVIARLLSDPPLVLATGGGAFMDAQTRDLIGQCGISVWLKADLDILMRRVLRRDNRPLLKTADPRQTMQDLIAARYPVYAKADIVVESRDVTHDAMVAEVLAAVNAHLDQQVGASARTGPAGQPQSRPEINAGHAGSRAAHENRTRSGAPTSPNSPYPPDTPDDQHGARMAVQTVPVALGSRSYDVLIAQGLLARAGEIIQERLNPGAVAIVTDHHLADSQHVKHVRESLDQAGIACRTVVTVPAGEASKSFQTLQSVCENLLASGLERGDLAIALGGGVIGDLAGFAASIIRRGIGFVQIPTSLLAQVDSSVGGKTGINTAQGKNLIGAFHQPRLVLADIDALATLPPRQFAAGYAEVVKYGLLGDRSFFDWLHDNRARLAAQDPQVVQQAVARSVEMKAEIVARDETETGERALLNLGHTFGHALEAWAGYSDRLLHGEAVAIGMCHAFQLSERLGYAPSQCAAQVAAHLRSMNLPTCVDDIQGETRPSVDELMTLMRQDKKVQRGQLTLILCHGIGHAFITRDVAHDTVRRFLEDQRVD